TFRPEHELPFERCTLLGGLVDCRKYLSRESLPFLGSGLSAGSGYEPMKLVAKRRGIVLPVFEALPVGFQLRDRADWHPFDGHNAREERLQLIEILLQNGVELVVVTLSAADR